MLISYKPRRSSEFLAFKVISSSYLFWSLVLVVWMTLLRHYFVILSSTNNNGSYVTNDLKMYIMVF